VRRLWFGFREPCPAGWNYIDDACGDYVDGGYFLYNPSYPGTRIAITLWFLGPVTSYTLGSFIHILLVMAVVVLVINLAQGRRAALLR